MENQILSLMVSVDIQTENGESILNPDFPNTVSTEIDLDTAKKFYYPKAVMLLQKVVAHFLADAFRGVPTDPSQIPIPAEVLRYNYELGFPSRRVVLAHYHTNTKVCNKNCRDKNLLGLTVPALKPPYL